MKLNKLSLKLKNLEKYINHKKVSINVFIATNSQDSRKMYNLT